MCMHFLLQHVFKHVVHINYKKEWKGCKFQVQFCMHSSHYKYTFPWYWNSLSIQSHLDGKNTLHVLIQQLILQITMHAFNDPPGTHYSLVAWESFPDLGYEPNVIRTHNHSRCNLTYINQNPLHMRMTTPLHS